MTSPKSILYDGSKSSVLAIMDMLGRTRGINNTPDYLYIQHMDGKGVNVPHGTILIDAGGGEFTLREAT